MTNSYNVILSNPFILVFLIGTVLTFLLNHFLEFICWKARRKNKGKLPEELQNIPEAQCFDTEKLEKIREYENAKYFSWIPYSIVNLAVTMTLVLSGFYPWLFYKVCAITGFPAGFGTTFLCALIFYFATSLVASIFSLPFELYNEFKIEKKFGFSNMTVKLWLTDKIKGLCVSLIITGILLAAIIAVLVSFPTIWWILVTIVILIFSIVAMVIYPVIIAPMFNKFTPLEDGELKERISALITNLGFKSSGIFVMDASKRSGHSNAYFGGFGKTKRIVLFDTLINQLTTDELEAVLGHELGHYKLKHITKRLCFLIPMELVLMFLLYVIAQSTSLYAGFGFAVTPETVISMQFIGLLLASMITSPLQELFSPVINYSSRRDEYQADKFSAKLTGKPEALISGLIKLNCENLSELLPPKLYVMWNYSHPSLLERINALKKTEN